MSAIIDDGRIPDRLQMALQALAGASAKLAELIRRGPFAEAGPKTLGGAADAMFRQALAGCGVRWLASANGHQVTELDRKGQIAIAINPLDGASRIDTNLPIGTLFSVYPAAATAEDSFLRLLRDQIAAGFVIYGPRCTMMLSCGDGVQAYALDPDSGAFRLAQPEVRVVECSPEFAINSSNYRHWPQPIRAFIDDCLAGAEGPSEENFNMRWTSSLVAEAHRILHQGGVYLYPEDARKGYERGRLRMLYECAPIAMLMEQAGGLATDGSEPILSASASAFDQRSPIVFGSADKVARVAAYHDLPEAEVSALFGKRGLFRA
ncbi:class 1 fructose-bisphosphatase [Paracoccus sulfuroxidans]|uniref:Fructose-1,6-bisphosphatase class 1 n=1 Tax=Paracoccus sulfuroxidans TaxID=384678 RepID=A0A562NV60_9RHOB|nr:class 1 fructose-bisphosphatase [Paracoccus sulfuroxidans]TWI35920.1 D-fructose 1,6-bisphosphatase [Paracoccus sulfuroxidans]